MLKLVVESLEGLDESVKSLYNKGDDGKFRLAVDGIEDTSGLKKALKAERDAREAFEKQVKLYEGIDPDEARTLIKRFGDDEEAQLIKAGKIDQVWERRTEKMRNAHAQELDKLTKAVESEKQKAQRWVLRALDSGLREAANKVGLHSGAVEDAVIRGRTVFTVDDEGNAVQLRDGAVVMGKDGKSPYSPTEWLEAMRESAPHWFPASGSGTGSPPTNNRIVRGNTMKRSAFMALDPASRAATVKEGTTIVD